MAGIESIESAFGSRAMNLRDMMRRAAAASSRLEIPAGGSASGAMAPSAVAAAAAAAAVAGSVGAPGDASPPAGAMDESAAAAAAAAAARSLPSLAWPPEPLEGHSGDEDSLLGLATASSAHAVASKASGSKADKKEVTAESQDRRSASLAGGGRSRAEVHVVGHLVFLSAPTPSQSS